MAEQIRSCQGLSTGTCSRPRRISPLCRQAVLNTALSAPSCQILSSRDRLEELQPTGLIRGIWVRVRFVRAKGVSQQVGTAKVNFLSPFKCQRDQFWMSQRVQVVLKGKPQRTFHYKGRGRQGPALQVKT